MITINREVYDKDYNYIKTTIDFDRVSFISPYDKDVDNTISDMLFEVANACMNEIDLINDKYDDDFMDKLFEYCNDNNLKLIRK